MRHPSRAVPLFDDHLPCPGLRRWLPDSLVEPVACFVPPGVRPPSALRRLIRTWPDVTTHPHALGSLIVAHPLTRVGDPLPPRSVLDRLRVGGIVVELAWPRGGLRRLRPWRWRRDLGQAAAERCHRWALEGFCHLEQWAAIDPTDILLTMGRRAAVRADL